MTFEAGVVFPKVLACACLPHLPDGLKSLDCLYIVQLSCTICNQCPFLLQRKDASHPATYRKPMTRAHYHLRLRLCLAILPVLMLLAGSWAQASLPVAGPMTVEICSDGVMKTVRIEDPGAPAPAPHDCSDCLSCLLPVPADLAPDADLVRPADWHPAFHPRPTAQAVPACRMAGFQSRGPPIQSLRHQA